MTESTSTRRGYRGVHRGFKIATASARRFVVVYFREEAREVDGDTYARVARIVLRTDNITTARRKRERIGYGRRDGLRAFIIDTATGEEIV